jgi:hypothetical protein
MGLYSLDTLPIQFDVVWCLFPYEGKKLQPGPSARATLVLDVRANEQRTAAGLLVAYGTGTEEENSPFLDNGPDLIIESKAAAIALGLHKPTRFSMWAQRRKQLLWSSDYFVPEPYRANAPIIAGSLSDEQIARVKACFKERGLDPYWTV